MYNAQQTIDFSGKTVIVTGGSMGIGEGCARVFISAGANVVICARGVEAGKKLESELSSHYGEEKCLFVQCDVSNEDQVKNVIGKTLEKYGRLDCLINNAGVHPEDERIDDVSVEMFNELLVLNLTSIFMFCKYALPHLRKTQGSIINMSSLVGVMGQRLACRYVPTKSAIIGLTKALAIDEAENNVRVNCVLPACVVTPLGEKLMNLTDDPAKQQKLIDSWHQVGRTGSITEVGSVCLFLASDMASFLTGIEISVSGGADLGYGVKFF